MFPTTNNDNSSPKPANTVSSRNYSLLQLFVESEWEKNEIKRLGAWLALQGNLVPVRDRYTLWGSTWGYSRHEDTYRKRNRVENADDFKRRITLELRNVLPLLLDCNDDINYTNDDGQTILHAYLANDASCYTKRKKKFKSMVFKIVKSLLDEGASVDATDNRGKTPLHVAAENEKLELIQLMLDSFAHIDACDMEGNTVLHKVVYYRNFADNSVLLNTVRTLLQSKGADPNKRNNMGMTPLQYAVSHCNIALLQIFQDYGGDFSNDNGADNLLNFIYTGGIYVSESRRIATIDYLVKQGYDVNIKDKTGLTILHLVAKRYLTVETIEKLIELGADVNLQTTKERQTPLHLMLHWTDLTIIGIVNEDKFNSVIPALLNAGADWDAVDKEGRKPLHHVLLADNNVALSCILKLGADINDETAKKLMKKSSKDSRKTVLLRAVDLRTVGFAIDKEYELQMNERIEDLENHKERCENEVNAMKKCIISDGLSIYQFMHMNWRRQAALADFVRSRRDLGKIFPIYHGLIQNVCNQAKKRHQLLESATMAFYHITRGDLMPDICVERVLHFLDTWSLQMLIDASENI